MRTAPGTHGPARRVGALVSALVAVVAACSLPTDERAVPYDVDDLRPGLSETTTTSTTSTTSTTTVVPISTEPGASTTVPETSTTSPIPTEPVTVYYTLGSTDDLQPVAFQRASPVSEPVVRQLLQAPTGIAEFGLFSSVRAGLIDDVVIDGNLATVILDSTILERMPPSQQRRAIAQIVLTYTSFRTPDQGNVGAVKFEADGESVEVFVPALNGTSQPGDELEFTDFSELISTATITATPTTTTTTTTVPDTVPPTSTEVETTAG